jgi:hypothetical protein
MTTNTLLVSNLQSLVSETGDWKLEISSLGIGP